MMVGLDHRSADLAARSRAALAVAALRAPGRVVLSTCNRAEVYFVGERPVLVGAFREGAALARHLFRVVAGMESASLGEAEIVMQVRAAHREARPGAALDLLFRRAFEAGKRVRTETGLGRGAASLGALAVREAAARHGCLEEAEILVLGAGGTAGRVAGELRQKDARRVRVLNRTPDHARALAEPNGFAWGALADLGQELHRADVVFAAAAAPRPIVTQTALDRALANRPLRKMTLVDLGVPPNVAPGLSLSGLRSLGLDALSAGDGHPSLPQAEAIVEEEVARYLSEVARRTALPSPLRGRGAGGEGSALRPGRDRESLIPQGAQI